MKNNLIYTSIFLVIFLVAWQFTQDYISASRIEAGLTGLNSFIPTPIAIFETFIQDGLMIAKDVLITTKKAIMGLILGSVFAIIMAILFLIFDILRKIFFPLFLSINSFPIIGFAPVIILAFGQGSFMSIVFIAALISYFPILIHLDAAFRSTNVELVEFAQVMGATRFQIIHKIILPLAVPSIFTAMKIAIPASIIGAMIGEWLGARTGVGQLITVSLYQLKPGILYASLILLTLVSVSLVYVFSIIEGKLIPWNQNLQKKI